MGVHALAVVETSHAEHLVLAAAPHVQVAGHAGWMSTSAVGMDSALQTLRRLHVHVEEQRAKQVDSIETVCAQFHGPPFVEYQMVRGGPGSGPGDRGAAAKTAPRLDLFGSKAAQNEAISVPLRVVAIWDNEPHEWHAQVLAREYLSRACAAVAKVYAQLLAKEPDAVAFVYSVLSSTLRGEFNETIPDSVTVSARPVQKLRSLFKRGKANKASTPGPAKESVQKKQSVRVLATGLTAQVVTEERADDVPDSLAKRKTSTGLFKKKASTVGKDESSAPDDPPRTSLQKLASKLSGKAPAKDLGTSAARSSSETMTALAHVADQVVEEESVLKLPEKCFDMARVGKPLDVAMGDLKWFVLLLQNEWISEEQEGVRNIERRTGNLLRGSTLQRNASIDAEHANAGVNRNAQYFAAFGNQFLGPKRSTYMGGMFPAAQSTNFAGVMQQQRQQEQQQAALLQRKMSSGGMAPVRATPGNHVQQQQQMMNAQQQQALLQKRASMGASTGLGQPRVPAPVQQQQVAVIAAQPPQAVRKMDPAQAKQQEQLKLRDAMAGCPPNTDPVRFKMNQFAETLQQGKLELALKQVQESLVVIRNAGGGVIEREKETQMCVRYVLGVKLALRIRALDAEMRAHVESSPEFRKRLLEAAALAALLGSLPLVKVHRGLMLRVAIEKNMAAGNYGVAAKFIREMMDIMPAAQQGDLIQQLQHCQQNGERDTRVAPTQRICYKSLTLVGSPVLKCNFCPALFSPQKGAVSAQQTCPFCLHGLILPMQ
ncbi:hypothetical protein FVE85_5133 [Porphyridium purpureum]|uniref:Coatomer alpha subunit C-terminal domain-containing protein n=1 Tax=Porphyridium purpureum TaxID=35688 RepID=A0A5J4Z2Q6_PORPP|nr:hypothetical protein FVE85_5133 [Porphyridium purpureum]|eukprot:POR5086..scf295_1